MSGHQYATLEDTVYFYFGANDTSGSGGDGATPLFDVREAGAAASAIPLLSGTPTLLTHANYPAGCYEVAVAATDGNGFAAGDTFGVFCTLAIDSQNPTGFIGSCKLTPLATAAALATAQTDLDTITGAAGVIIAPAQGPIVFTGVSNEPGISLIGHGTGAGFEVTGGATGDGLLSTGGATSGAGLKAIAGGGGSGVHFAGIGANAGLRADGGATGAGGHFHGGATSGPGLNAHAHGNNDDALVLIPHGTGEAAPELVDNIWDEPLTGATHNVATSSGKRLRQIDAGFEVHSGTAQAGSSTTITLDTGASASDTIYDGDRCVITAGTGMGEHGLIKTYDGTTKIAIMSKAWVITPDATSEFILLPADVDVELWNGNTVTGDGDWANVQDDLDTLTAVATEARLAELDAGNMPTDLANIESDTTAILSDTGEIGTAGAGLTDLGGMSVGMKAEVNVEADAALDTAIPELGVAIPTATPTVRTALALLYMALRNKVNVQTSGTDALEIHNSAGTLITKKLITDDGTDYSEAKMS